jgi:hypothetical protein
MSSPSWGRSGIFAVILSPVAVAVAGAVAVAAVVAAGVGGLLLATGSRSGPTPINPGGGDRATRPATTTTPATTTIATTAAPTTAATTTTAVPRQHPPTDRQPELVAAAFTAAFLSFRWDESSDALRRRCRPWATDAIDAALAWPGVPPDRDRRAANHETDLVAVDAVSPQDRAVDHLDVTVAAAVTLAQPGRATQLIERYLDLQVTSTPAGWAVDQVSQ